MHILSSSNMTKHLSLALKLTNNTLLTCDHFVHLWATKYGEIKCFVESHSENADTYLMYAVQTVQYICYNQRQC